MTKEIEWTYEKKNIDELIPNSRNPRKLSKETADYLKKSIGKYGICQPVVINTNGKIIGGHQRLKILKLLGKKSVVIAYPDRTLNQKEADELLLGLNKHIANWDYDIMANEWEIEDLIEVGFTYKDLGMEGPSEETQEPENKSCSMNIKFMDVAHLQEAENAIATIVDSYPGSTYKVRLK